MAKKAVTQKVNPVIHDFAVRLATHQLPEKSSGLLTESEIKGFYENYVVAVKVLTELEKDEDFKANALPRQPREGRMKVT